MTVENVAFGEFGFDAIAACGRASDDSSIAKNILIRCFMDYWLFRRICGAKLTIYRYE